MYFASMVCMFIHLNLWNTCNNNCNFIPPIHYFVNSYFTRTYVHSLGVCCQIMNGNDLMISNLHAWSMRQLGWTEPPHPAQTRDQFFPLRKTTHSQSQRRHLEKYSHPSHCKTYGEDAQFFSAQRHIQDGGQCCPPSEGVLGGKRTGDRDTIERDHRYQRLWRSKDKCSLNFLVAESKQTE